MRCSRINELLFLKPAELTSEELGIVKTHLSECRRCAEEFAQIARTNDFIARINDAEPFLTNETDFTDKVMQSIESIEAVHDNPLPNIILNIFSNFFLNTVVRATAVAIILILVSTFLFQQYTVLNSVSNLENSLAVKNSTITTTNAGFNEVKVLRLAADFIELFKGDRLYTEITGSLILTNKTKLNEFLTLYSDLQNYKSLFSKEIEEKYPELNSFLGKKLDIEELQDFVKKNESLIKELSRKLPAGGK